MKSFLPIVLFLFVVINLKAQTPLQNGGFETWTSTESHAYETELVSLFAIPNVLSGVIENWTTSSPFGTIRTTDSYSGNYSLIIHNWYGYAWTTAERHEKITSNITGISGYFKYIGTDLTGTPAAGKCEVFIKDALNDTIGSGVFNFNNQNTYLNFIVPITYTNANAADSVIVKFTNAYQSCPSEIVCNLLYLDDIGYITTPLSVDEEKANPTIKYTALHNLIELGNVESNSKMIVYDLSGKIVFSINIQHENSNILLPQLGYGLYLVKIENEHFNYTQKIVIGN